MTFWENLQTMSGDKVRRIELWMKAMLAFSAITAFATLIAAIRGKK